MRKILAMTAVVVLGAASIALAEDNVYRSAEKIESKTFLLQKEKDYQQALTQLEALKLQAEKDRIQQEVELSELRKKYREISGSTGDPKVVAIMGAESNLDAVLSFSDGSTKTFRTGDVLPGGGKIAGITESEVLVTKKGKSLVTLAYETPKTDVSMEMSVYQPGGGPNATLSANPVPAPTMSPSAYDPAPIIEDTPGVSPN
jgi:type IV pilus biogenesis protein PilP